MPNSRMAIITFLDGGGSGGNVDNTLPGGPPQYPGNALPPYYGGRPDNTLPGGGHISLLPVFPFDPTLPDNALPNAPSIDNSLPRPGKKYVVKWLACQGLILVPDNELPATPEPK